MIQTNEIIYGFKYNPNNPEPIRYGRALAAANNYCAVTPDGDPIFGKIIGEKEWNIRAEKAYRKIAPFIRHLNRIFTGDPRDTDMFLDYMAFKMQYPGVKPRWALVIAGDQGVGKDIAIDACWHTYGMRYVNSISPADVLSNFNDYMRCILLRISEVADLGESNKWIFNEKVKVLISGHPDRMLINPKYGVKYWLKMYNGTVLTTNHLDDGIYIPEGDRRYYVIKCASWKQLGLDYDERAQYFDNLFRWFTTADELGRTGYEWIGHYLYWCRDVSKFNCNVCPAPTKAKLAVISNGKETSSTAVDDALVEYTNMLRAANRSDLLSFMWDSKLRPVLVCVRKLGELLSAGGVNNTNAARVAGMLRKQGYVRMDCPSRASDGKWVVKPNAGSCRKEILYVLSAENAEWEDGECHVAQEVYSENTVLREMATDDIRQAYFDFINSAEEAF